MILLLHIMAALGSMAQVTYTFFRPSRAMLYVGYAATAATLGSGAYLVVARSAPLLQTCTTGLLYVSVMTVGLVTVRHRLAAVREPSRTSRQR